MAQRLVRLLCPECKQKVEADERTRRQLGKNFKGANLHKAVGCESCYYTGYSGRKAIYEVIPVDEELAKAIREARSDVGHLLEERHIRTLGDSAMELLEEGKTSLEEVLPFI